MIDYIFLYRLLHNEIDCSPLVGGLRFKQIDRELRFIELFDVPMITREVMLRSVPVRLSVLGNEYQSEFDLQGASLYELRNFVRSKYLYG